MQFKKVALLTLAALASQNLTGEGSSFANSPTPNRDTPQGNYKADRSSDTAPVPIQSVSAPETLASEQFTAGNARLEASQGWLMAAQPEFSVTAKSVAIAKPALDIAAVLKETWLAKLVELSADRSPQVREAIDAIALRTNVDPQSEGAFNNTVTLLNALLIVSTLLPGVTIAFFWLVRRLVVRELIADANKRLRGIGVMESELKTSSELSQRLKEELEAQMSAAKHSVEFIAREAELSRSSIDQIETLKSQFLMHLQVLLTEVYQTKSQTVQELAQIPAVARQEAIKPESQLEATNSRSNVVPFQKPQETLIADDYIKQGEALYFEGRYQEALVSFEKAILMNADIDEAWYNRGNVLVKVQRLEEAIACYDQAIGLNRDYYEAWYNRGNVLMRLQRYEEAAAAYDEAIALKPEEYGPWHNRAAAMGRLQRYQDAIASYEKALSIKSDDPEVWHTRAAMLGKLQRYAEAVASYDQALTIGADRYETWYNRGNMLWRLQRYAEAITSYDKAIAINPDKYEVWYNRGAVLGKLQQYEEAIASYDRAISIQPNDYEIWHNRGVAFGRLSKYVEAIASYEQAIAIQPQCYEAWFGKGETFAKLQEYEEAIAAYDRAIAIKPESYDAWRHRGTAFSELKQYEEAMVCYDKAIAIKPDNAEAWRDRGALLSELKQDSEAVASLSQAISIQQNLARNPDNSVQQNSSVANG
ncbi:tetratricopeptide repeat protein [Kamptonema sp. UHCC 0994]|uniref:tetratricopeptide repeat protein n=1 Tax=Kamptonema sp. UHCC 0994 TaxID=3031329 RepID=UPI0023B8E3BD|nr:tetratricopeptide repeat protein [Kamptonema sp. UHCC 0994]MDF0554162.1 tetratricopeptide repeat protein [Kamptonema sp. UHCC 0994]